MAEPLVKIVFKNDREDIFLPLSALVLEGENLDQISDKQIIERVARRLNKDVSEFEDSVVARSKTSYMVILPKSEFDKAVTVTTEKETTIAEAQVQYQVDEALAENTSDQAIIAQLEKAIDRNDPRAFVQIVDEVDWDSQPVENFIQVIDLAMSQGYLPLAKQLTEKGQVRFSTNETLTQTARALAPPVVRRRGPATPGLADTIHWMKKHAAEYKGQWIAVRSGELLAVASSLDELIETVGGLEELAKNALVHKVL